MYMNDGNKTKINLRNKSVFITGVAGFIGSNLAKRLLSTVEGVKVVGLDNMNHYYDVRLKEARLNELEQFDNFSFVKGNLADKAVIESIFEQYKPEIVVNLGAQAGVRYSITNPDAYVEANLIGFYNILEACRHSYDEGHTPVEHLVYTHGCLGDAGPFTVFLAELRKHVRLLAFIVAFTAVLLPQQGQGNAVLCQLTVNVRIVRFNVQANTLVLVREEHPLHRHW